MTVVAVPWATPRSSSTPTSPRLLPAATAVFPSYVATELVSMMRANNVQAHEQHRAYLKSLPATSYPLEPTGDAAEVNESQRVTEGGFEQR